ncbi:MAG: hypothetical protein PVF26_19600 [Desulfobacterales bacterium]|jgi:hypothetical protein
MNEEISLSEYRSLAYSLRRIKPLGVCCSNVLLEPVQVEPLEGRNEAQVKRTCIVKCPECNKMYTSKWN